MSSCPKEQPVKVRGHCRPRPRLRHPIQFNPYVAESVCRDRRKARSLAYSQTLRAGPVPPQGPVSA